MSKAKDWIKIALKFSFAFLIIGYMVYSGRLDLVAVKKGFSQVHLLVVCIILQLFSLSAALYRWGLLMKGQNVSFHFKQLVRYGMIGAFFNTTMPGAVSGDIIKAWYVIADRKQQRKTPVLTSILLDRVMGVFGLIIVSASPLFLQWEHVWSVPQLSKLATAVLLLFFFVILFFTYIMLSVWGPLAYLRKKMDVLATRRWGEVLLQAYDAWMSYRKSPLLLLKAVVLAVCTHLFVVVTVILCSYALGETHLNIYQYFLLVPIGLLTTAIPVAPAGLGVGHLAFAALFSLAGSDKGAEIFTMYVTMQIFINLTGVFFYLRSPKVQPLEAKEA